MNRIDVQVGLTTALGDVSGMAPDERTAAECKLADAVYGFLMVLKGRSPWYIVIGIRAIHGAISDWKRSRGCP